VQLRFFRFVERFAGRISDRIINVCTHECELALNNGIARVEKLSVIHNGMPDVAPHLMAHPAIQPPRIIMIARMDDQKDHATLLRALAQLSGYDWQLDLIGDGPLAASHQQLVRNLSLSERVRILGDAGWSVGSHLAATQIFVLASHFEGFPRSILEAMRAGLPVIATDVSGVREAVDHGSTGFLVPKCGVDALRDRLRTLITDPHLRVEMGTAARRRYLSEFTFEKMYQKTLALYRDVLLSRASGGDHPDRRSRAAHCPHGQCDTARPIK
jgi:glycosyltransferase involved in cell wall biosynthesis